MEVSYLHHIPFSSIRSPSSISRVSHAFLQNPRNQNTPFSRIRRRNLCSACRSADTLVAGSPKEEGNSRPLVRNGEVEVADLKSWMHSQGLPPCKVVLKERPVHGRPPIHYVAASEDLEVIVFVLLIFSWSLFVCTKLDS